MRSICAFSKRSPSATATTAMSLMSAHLQGVESYWNDLIANSDLAASP